MESETVYCELSVLSPEAIDALERDLGWAIPRFYRELLTTWGHGEWDAAPMEPYAAICEIYDPREIEGLYATFFTEGTEDALFRDYLPFGCNNATQDMWVIDVRSGGVAAISHEVIPEDWPHETWMSAEEWKARYLESLGA